MNSVNLIGWIQKKPNIRTNATSGKKFANFILRVDRRVRKDGAPDADYFAICALDKSAEFCEKYLHEGMKIGVTGELQNNNYTDASGKEVRNIRIIVHSFDFAERKEDPLSQMGAALSYAS